MTGWHHFIGWLLDCLFGDMHGRDTREDGPFQDLGSVL